MIKELTIILVTIHPEKVNKFVKYHAISRIIVADGSSKLIDKKLNVQKYIKMPGSSYFDRVNASLKQVMTKYVMLAGDDEFFNLPIISRSLIENPNATLIIGRTLLHDGFNSTAFREQYHRYIVATRKLTGSDKDTDVILSLVEEDTVYWYGAFSTDYFKRFCSYYHNNNEMVNFELSIPFHVLLEHNGSIVTVNDIWLKRAKYSRVAKINSMSSNSINNALTANLAIAYRSKIFMYLHSRTRRNELLFYIWNGITRKLKRILYILKLVRPNYIHDF
jgi:hypothetical protein